MEQERFMFTIEPCFCDPTCAFFEERAEEFLAMEEKYEAVVEQWMFILENPLFQACSLSFSDSESTRIVSKSTERGNSSLRLTCFDMYKKPYMHKTYENIRDLAEVLSDFSIKDTEVYVEIACERAFGLKKPIHER